MAWSDDEAELLLAYVIRIELIYQALSVAHFRQC
jgi:hypothetical protein